MIDMSCFENNLKISDITLNYYEKGSGKTIIILHGNGMTSLHHKKMFLTLSKDFNVISIDTRGHGLSETGDKPFSINLFSKDIIEFCKVKALAEVTLIGFSDGANISLLIVKEKPSLVENMILISGNYKGAGIHTWFLFLLHIYKLILFPFKDFSEKLGVRYNLIDLMIDDIGIDANDLSKITIPALILCAHFDVIKFKHTEELKNNLENASLKTVRFCTHMNIFNKTTTINYINEFLKK